MTSSKTDGPPVLGILVGHGGLPQALLDAASEIVGTTDAIPVVSNKDIPAGEMESRLEQIVDDHPDRDVLVFVDFYGSSCSNVSARIKRRHPGRIELICGINLPMLIRFLYYRGRLDLPRLAELMLKTGRDEIRPGSA